MILSVSRRTDVPALYSDWFFDRVKEGFILTANPFFPRGKIAKVKIEPVKVEENILGGKSVTGNVDGIIFWTKNPRLMMSRLDELKDFIYYFHFILNPYNEVLEPNVPTLEERIETFKELSQMIGADKVIWRYDPILLSKEIDVAWHMKQFENLAKQLNGFTKSCHTSFLIGQHNDFRAPTHSQMSEIMREFSRIATENGIQLYACAQKHSFPEFGVKASRCTDGELFVVHMDVYIVMLNA